VPRTGKQVCIVDSGSLHLDQQHVFSEKGSESKEECNRTPQNPVAKAPWSVIHSLDEEDSSAVAALRSVVAPMKGKFEGISGNQSPELIKCVVPL
jgi:hypothetical protein